MAYRGASIAQARRGKRQVFRRKGRARLPIAVQTARIEAQATDYLENDLSGSRDFEQQFRQVFEHELTWRMRRR
ncbi:MAG: phage tail protein [Lautropia mirabilis]